MIKRDPVARALRAQLAAERREFAAALAAYEAQPVVPVAPRPEPARYTVTTLPSALKRKAAAEKAARTRRLRRQGLA